MKYNSSSSKKPRKNPCKICVSLVKLLADSHISSFARVVSETPTFRPSKVKIERSQTVQFRHGKLRKC
jgi:hypothetical protein